MAKKIMPEMFGKKPTGKKSMSDMMGIKKAHPSGCKCANCKKGKC